MRAAQLAENVMQAEREVTNGTRRAGRIISGLPALFLLVDGAAKLVKPAPVVEATVNLGYAKSVV